MEKESRVEGFERLVMEMESPAMVHDLEEKD